MIGMVQTNSINGIRREGGVTVSESEIDFSISQSQVVTLKGEVIGNAGGSTPRQRVGKLSPLQQDFITSGVTAEEGEISSVTQSLREFERLPKKLNQKGVQPKAEEPLSAADQVVEYFWKKDMEFKNESLNKHFLMVKKGVEKNRETMKSHTRFFQKELADFKSAAAMRKMTSKIDTNNLKNLGQPERRDAPMVGVSLFGPPRGRENPVGLRKSEATSPGPERAGSRAPGKSLKQRSEKQIGGSHFNEHEFNNIFKIINYLDNEQDIVIQRKEFRKRIRTMNERARLDLAIRDDDEEVFLSHLEVGEVLGEGSYASVKLAHLREDPTTRYALKIYSKASLADKIKMQNMELEIEILQSLDHPNIVKLHNKVVGSRNIFLLMEYVSRNSLQDYLNNQPTGSFSEAKTVGFYIQLVKAVAYLHSNNVVHRDLKLQNILVDKRNNLRLIDFGFAVRVEQDSLLRVYCGTPSYMSPEIVSRTPYEGKASDIWALGCLLFKMVTGTFPFKGASEEDLFSSIISGSYEVSKPISPSLKNLLSRMLCVQPSMRISAKDILDHAWFVEALAKEAEATRIEPGDLPVR